MSDDDDPYRRAVRHADHLEAAALWGRRTAWERCLDDDDAPIKPGPCCFACAHLGAYDGCRLVTSLAMSIGEKRRGVKAAHEIALRIIDLVEYRAASDPHAECPGFELAERGEIDRRLGVVPTAPAPTIRKPRRKRCPTPCP